MLFISNNMLNEMMTCVWPVHKYNKHSCHLLLTSGVGGDRTVGRGKFSDLTSKKKPSLG